jgi:RNA polymerase sigma factor for flagellar operon FliA
MERAEAIISLMPVVVGIAHKVHRQVPDFPVDDLISEGWIGAMHAVDRYDPERGATLSTFAGTRIRGQMMDHIRQYSWLSRKDYAEVKDGTAEFSLRSIDEPLVRGGSDDEVSLVDLLPDDEDAITRMVDEIAIRTVIAQLSEKHRSVLVAYFFDGLTLQQIADLEGVTESRISQKLKAAREAAYRQLEK